MNLLSSQSYKRIDQYFKFIGQILTYKQFAYLSFFVNQKGDKLKYNRDLNFSSLYRNPTHSKNFSLQEYLDTQNFTFIYRKTLLTGLFNNHILSEKETFKILQNCVNLDLKAKKDMVNFMFGNKISYEIKHWLTSFKKGELNNFSLNFTSNDGKLPDQKRKNFFILFQNEVNDFDQIQKRIIENDFFSIPNVNKILCLDLKVQNIHRFNNELLKKESFFKEKNIKIKNIASDKVPEIFEEKSLKLGFRIQKLFEYASRNMKGNTLLHQLPEYYKFYNQAEKTGGSLVSSLYKYQPRELFLFLQRKGNIENQNEQFTFQELSKNFQKRFENDPYFEQNQSGLQIVRYLSSQNRTKNLKMIKMQQKGTYNIPMQ